ncbi:TlpA family protein disulfide reductase [Winogradskyella alexanderae]|uniref:TlpA family protein disulfide reductase n=1 Tax=Winogradskyella alexanderae TaxID=2877123 RepID=A0ABS7XV84_9FLAO|nr:TlpA disulfide reductase family protein [Winogradskyella alexanderae]MCA0133923.1 TlpA family protein disulfide reductase [Winogradskyella alexanderae]
MKNILILIIIASFLSCSDEKKVAEIGKKIPDYSFNEILNKDKEPFNLNNRDKPIIIEFWATWCSPCIPAMKKLENYQEKFDNDIEIITVSTDNRKNLNRYIENTQTSLRVAFDTTHLKIFNYKYIPHAILIDKNGIVQAITTPDKITEETINDLIKGKPIKLEETEVATSNFSLNKEFKNNNYQYKLTSENKNLGFKNEIKRDENGEPISLDFRNVSIYRLMTDIYGLSSAARIYTVKELPSNKYCFNLEQKENYKKGLLENAKEILNKNLAVRADLVEKEVDSAYVLEIVDKSKLPEKSNEEKYTREFRGPFYSGKKLTSYNLIEYLENEVQKPIKDKTQLDYEFDIELNWSYEDGFSLNRELEKHGFRINISEQPEKIKMLKLSKNNGG